jgi:hypothetical protein
MRDVRLTDAQQSLRGAHAMTLGLAARTKGAVVVAAVLASQDRSKVVIVK